MPTTENLTQNYMLHAVVADYLEDEMQGDTLLKLLPPDYVDTSLIEWEQPDNGYGLLSLRGLNGEPDIAPTTGFKRNRVAPGYYGEKVIIDETELTVGRQIGELGAPIDKDYLINWRTQQQTQKFGRILKYIVSQLFVYGKYLVRKANGSITHGDQITNFNALVPGTSWSTYASSTPIFDLLTWRTSLQTGTSSKFDERSRLLMTSNTLNDLLQSNQVLTMWRLKYGETPLGQSGLQEILTGMGLPRIEVYDEGYFADPLSAQTRTNLIKYLPLKGAAWVGYRPNDTPIGKFYLTRNLTNNPPSGNAPDLAISPKQLEDQAFARGLACLLEYHYVPPKYELYVGFNGGPAIEFPSALAGITYT